MVATTSSGVKPAGRPVPPGELPTASRRTPSPTGKAAGHPARIAVPADAGPAAGPGGAADPAVRAAGPAPRRARPAAKTAPPTRSARPVRTAQTGTAPAARMADPA